MINNGRDIIKVQKDQEILNENYDKYLEVIPRLKKRAVTIIMNVFCR